MKRYRNTTNTMLGLYDIGVTVGAGKVIAVTEQQISSSRHLQLFIVSGKLEKVSAGADDLMFKVDKAPAVVLPAGARPVAVNVLSAMAESTIDDMGQVIVKGELPGTGELKTMAAVVAEGMDKLQESFAAAVKPPDTGVKPVEVTDNIVLTDELRKWFRLRNTEKKSAILNMVDTVQLTLIAAADTDVVVKKLIAQRIKEIRNSN